jgi:hypothetical protein
MFVEFSDLYILRYGKHTEGPFIDKIEAIILWTVKPGCLSSPDDLHVIESIQCTVFWGIPKIKNNDEIQKGIKFLVEKCRQKELK